jgi:hypothetical protein
MNRKNILLIALILMLSTIVMIDTSLSFSQNKSSKELEDLFDKIRNNYLNKLPNDFTAVVESRKLENELDKVNEDIEKVNPDEPFVIKFLYKKEFGERLLVENACMLTRNKFQDYLEVYKSFRSFLDPSVRKDDFFRQYKWEQPDKGNEKFYVIKMTTRGIKNEYYMMYINKETLFIERSFYYKHGSPVGRVDLEYTKKGKYTVPSLIKGYTWVTDIMDKLIKKEFSIKLKNFKINQNLTVDDILSDEGIDC